MRDIARVADQGWDIVVVGGGNAALCAAIEAAETGASVILLAGASEPCRGGNSRHTRNFRCMHHGALGPLIETCDEDEFYDDLLLVTKGDTDEHLARLVIRASQDALPWMQERGVRFQAPLARTLSIDRTNAFFLGGGKALVNVYNNTAEDLGVAILHEAQVRHVGIESNRSTHVEVETNGQTHRKEGRGVVLASGGFQGDIDWLARAWGESARNFLIRGTPYNKGVVIDDMIRQGAESVSDPPQCHAVAIDGSAPQFDGGLVMRLDCVPFSVVVNRDGERYYDEEEDVWPKRYAIWGRLGAAQPGQIAFSIIDSRSIDLFMPSVYPPESAGTLEGLAQKMGLPRDERQGRCGGSTRPAARASSSRRTWTDWPPTASSRPGPTGPGRSRSRRSAATCCARA